MLALVTFEQFANAYMDWASRFTPLKFDYFLYLVDKNLGVSAFSVARLFSEWQVPLLLIVYQSLIWAMLSWYWVVLKSRDGRPNRLLIAYLINFLAGPGLYLLVPGRGPRHAFGAAFPMGSPDVSPVLVQLNGWPNAIPSAARLDGASVPAVRRRESRTARHRLGVSGWHRWRDARL